MMEPGMLEAPAAFEDRVKLRSVDSAELPLTTEMTEDATNRESGGYGSAKLDGVTTARTMRALDSKPMAKHAG